MKPALVALLFTVSCGLFLESPYRPIESAAEAAELTVEQFDPYTASHYVMGPEARRVIDFVGLPVDIEIRWSLMDVHSSRELPEDAYACWLAIDYKAESWSFWQKIADSDGRVLPLVQMSRDVYYGGKIKELVGIPISEDYFQRHQESGMDFALLGSSGDRVHITLSPEYLQGFKMRRDQHRREHAER